MRSILLVAAILALFSPLTAQAQKAPKEQKVPKEQKEQKDKKPDVTISSDVVKTADWAAFKYMEIFEKAKAGDQKSIKEFLEFTPTLDGAETLQHLATCIELIPFTTDEKMGAILYVLKPKLRVLLLEQFPHAQGLIKKEEMRKPLQEWAPLTWKGLNGEKVVCSSCMSQGLSKAGGQKPVPPGAGAEVMEPTTPPAGKQ